MLISHLENSLTKPHLIHTMATHTRSQYMI